MKRIISIVLLMALLIGTEAKAQNLDDTKQIKVTCYTGGTITASGCKPRHGIAAGEDVMLYDRQDGGSWVALVWTADGTEFLGYYEILDRGGTDAIRKHGTVLDIYQENYEECVEFMAKTQGKILVKYVKAYG